MRTLMTLILLGSVATAADLKDALMSADREFAKKTAEKGLDGWMSFMSDEIVRTRRPGEKLTVGTEAVHKEDASIFADPTKKLVWEPIDAHGFKDGKSGVTSGRYKVVMIDKGGKESTISTGGYVTWWRQDSDGAWKVIFDTGVPDPANKK